MRMYQKKVRLLEAVHKAMKHAFIDVNVSVQVWEDLLSELVFLTESSYGFIGEVVEDESHYRRCLKINAITRSDDSSKRLYNSLQEKQMLLCGEFCQALYKEKIIINNNLLKNEIDGFYLLKEHLNITRYACIPIYYGDKIVGVYSVANATKSYSHLLIQFLEPFTATCGVLINSLQQSKKLEVMAELDRARRSSDIHQARHTIMGEMIAMISHQWRQPLALSMLNVDILTKKVDMLLLDEKDKRFLLHRLSLISDMVQEQSHLITDFTDFFKPDKEKVHFHVFSSVNSVLSMFESNLSSYNIALSTNVDQDCILFGGEREFRQVILNIVKNAIDQLVEHPVTSPFIHIDVVQHESLVVIEVSDNGGGIPLDLIDSIFDAYISTKSLNGTGLGLYMVKMIIVDHFQGEISVYNSDIGAVFRIVIPIDNSIV